MPPEKRKPPTSIDFRFNSPLYRQRAVLSAPDAGIGTENEAEKNTYIYVWNRTEVKREKKQRSNSNGKYLKDRRN